MHLSIHQAFPKKYLIISKFQGGTMNLQYIIVEGGGGETANNLLCNNLWAP